MRKATHNDVRYHFVKDCVENGVLLPEYVRSAANIADKMTKLLDRLKFETFRSLVGLIPIAEKSSAPRRSVAK